MVSSAEIEEIEGFYSGYFTGVFGTSFGLFVFRGGIIVGVDAGNARYDGTYKLSSDGRFIEAHVRLTIPLGGHSITGASAAVEPLAVEIPLKLPSSFVPSDVHRIETPTGPVNAKFEKIRGV